MNRDLKRKSLKILSCLDLTLLDKSSTEKEHLDLVSKANSKLGTVAAVCVNPEWAAFCREKLPDSIAVACVINFPCGTQSQTQVLKDIDVCLDSASAQEIDYVLDYKNILQGNFLLAEEKLKEVVQYIKNKKPSTRIKVILEVGELKEADLIYKAAQLAMVEGVSFIKTSTGKVPVNASLESADIMLKAIDNSLMAGTVGFKAAGGVKTVEDAWAYLLEYESRFGAGKAHKHNFRIGASSLYDDIMIKSGEATGPSSNSNY